MNEFVGHASTDLAMQLFREGKLQECIGCAEKVTEAYPDDAMAYTILGAAYSQCGDHGMAIAAFEKALAWDDSARAHYNLGRALEASGRTKNALEQYTAAILKDPDHIQASEASKRLASAGQPDADSEFHEPRLLSQDSGDADHQGPP